MKNAGHWEPSSSSCKRTKFSTFPHDLQQQHWSHAAIDTEPTHHSVSVSPLEESSPLGLRLRKTPSLLDLIQLNISRKNMAVSGSVSDLNQEANIGKDARRNVSQTSADKRKATNFSASILRIGTWECIARHEGQLVVKCYFAKRKLVWEILEGGLKSKIEIQWSDITGLKATCPVNEPGTLQIEVSKPPLFFREANPQPRKHTVWQAASDFTGGQASIYKKHFLQFPQGLLDKHYEKLIQSDARLNMLSKKAFGTMDSPMYFESIFGALQDQREQRACWSTVLEEDESQFGLPQSAYDLNNMHLPPLVSVGLSDTEQVVRAPKSEYLDPPEERFYGNPQSSSQGMTWSSNRKMFDEIAAYLLGDSSISDDRINEYNGLSSSDRCDSFAWNA